jgi:hypothetical protein
VVNASAVVLAGSHTTVVDVNIAIFALKARLAMACIGVEMALADGTVLTGIGLAHVDFLLTLAAFITIPALADELVESVLAGGAIKTRVRGAFIHVGLASRPIEAAGTITFVAGDNINAVSSIFTGIIEAFVDFGFTVAASISGTASALEQRQLNILHDYYDKCAN